MLVKMLNGIEDIESSSPLKFKQLFVIK